MGKADIAVKNWLNDNERFADLFNGSVFNGQKIILPDELEDLDRETDILITDKKDRRRGLQRHRQAEGLSASQRPCKEMAEKGRSCRTGLRESG